MSRLSICIFLTAWLLSCSSTKESGDQVTNSNKRSIVHNPTTITPPNGVRINDTLFVDQTEISNISWKEYTYNQKESSDTIKLKFKEIYPDTKGYILLIDDTGTLSEESLLKKSTYHYDRLLDHYPVIGITLDQAKKFSAWRSMIVFEVMLVKAGIIKPRVNKFDLKKFLASKAYKKHKDKITHYPQYFIPSIEDYEILKSKILNKEFKPGEINTIERSVNHQKFTGLPMRPTRDYEIEADSKTLYNIIGNVSELTDKENLTFGGNYLSTQSDALKMEIDTISCPSQLVGFRNFCKWIRIEDIIIEE